MGGTGIGTSLILIATGAVLAFAVDYQVTGISIQAIGAILIVVGIIGLLFSLALLNDWGLFGTRRVRTDSYTDVPYREPPTETHTHTHVNVQPDDRRDAPDDGYTEVETVRRRRR